MKLTLTSWALSVIFFAILFIISPFSSLAQNKDKPLLTKQTQIIAPNKKHSLLIKEYSHPREGLSYEILLKNSFSKEKTSLPSDGTFENAFWSPNGVYIAINQHFTSDFNNCFIYNTSKKQLLNLQEFMLKYSDPLAQETIEKHDHVYFEALKWVSPNILEVEIFGHGRIKTDEDKQKSSSSKDSFAIIYHFDLEKLSLEKIDYLPK